ncbi:RNA 2'-phosphotransferase [Streptococcus oricebi]|uniref:Probable RNA 2'-phosphotransferase n=1 Tax=Streptococcus oricebi TaxID=1547447 RepID=A0ABS5B4S5_9STRE|nr:RNA 2'-phosphotransferase [Streptococcus oricebi]MBP2623848.1 RNA 2'-phosphotransferase [Streptococcus oricebi]
MLDYTKLSREVSYILRHNPDKYGIKLDAEGWCSVDDLIDKLSETPLWKGLTRADLETMIELSDKKRHEIKAEKIRAFYGHSIKNKLSKTANKPPKVLYHGTVERFLNQILQTGLIPKERQYVHLSSDVNTAQQVALRRDDRAIILEVAAQSAWENGVKFYIGNEDIWLSDPIPSEYISIIEDK